MPTRKRKTDPTTPVDTMGIPNVKPRRKSRRKPTPFPADVDSFTRFVYSRYAVLRDTDDWQDAMFLLRHICRTTPAVMSSNWFIEEAVYLNDKYDLLGCRFLVDDYVNVALDAAMWRHVGQPLINEQSSLIMELVQTHSLPDFATAWVQAHIEDAKRTLAYWEEQT
jgi:hypothetical protein